MSVIHSSTTRNCSVLNEYAVSKHTDASNSRNWALSVSSPYSAPTSCKKAKKSLEPFLRFGADYQLTNQPTGLILIGPAASGGPIAQK